MPTKSCVNVVKKQGLKVWSVILISLKMNHIVFILIFLTSVILVNWFELAYPLTETWQTIEIVNHPFCFLYFGDTTV